MKTKPQFTPYEAIHPGSIILDELKARGLTQKQIASELNVQPTLLNELIKGKRALTADFALLFERLFEIPAEYWSACNLNMKLILSGLNKKTLIDGPTSNPGRPSKQNPKVLLRSTLFPIGNVAHSIQCAC